MDMKHCLLRRLLGLVPLLLGISFLSFVLIQLSPGDPAEVVIRVNDMTPTPELLAEVRTQLGLDRPFPERYLRWLADVLRGDLGMSYVNGRPVAGELARALPPTLMLAGTAAAIMLACSLAVALVCVRHEGRVVDRLLRALLFLGTSVPAFWAGLLLIWLFSVHLDWLPTGGLEGPSSLVLPAVTLALPYLAAYARLLRNSMVQTAQENFVLYARACGRSRGAILRMVLRNSLQASLTALGMSLPKLVAGSFVVECIFAWPGLGRLCVTAIFNRDLPVIQAYVLLMAVLFVAGNLCMDICAGLLAPWLTPWDPLAVDGSRKLAPCGPEHWLGTDRLGRDIFSRLLYGARATLGVSLLAMGATVSLGALLGMLAGLVRGRVESCLMRLCDVMLSFPGEVMVLAIVGMLGPGLENVVLACVVAKWPWYARMMRTITLRYADRDFVRFARVAGYGTGHIMRRHLLPCAAGEISVLATLDTGAVILMVSALSFLGLGVQPPTPEWGMMLGEAREVMVLYPWQMLPPGLAILLVVAACNYLGDSLRDALDPRHAMHKEPVL